MSIDAEQRLFEACLDAAGDDERERLLEACPDGTLRERVRRLLRASAQAPSSIASGFAEVPRIGVPAQVGSYRILEPIGEGAMGDVYLAEQHAPVRRRVALKILKFGLATREVIGRFELERQTLALMTHTNIARIFDAGATDDGRPYFVMEYVSGMPITAYCDERRLDLDARLRLFAQVCAGVQHAHLRGIIHRDLKPSNILVAEVDGQPVPKIIDFGIAKATTLTATGTDVQTRLGNILGTPEYMSPEQVQLSPLEIDARVDVYSLGVVLYELLTGSRPYPVTRDVLSPAVLAHEILERDIVRPSVRAAERSPQAQERAACRALSAAGLAARLRGDLDWITLKALEKDRQRRYASPAEIAADIERRARHEAVLAGPPSAVYRMTKFARRHRIAVTALSALFVAAIVFGSGMGWLAHEAARERDRASQEAEVARRVTAFTAGLFELANPMSAGSRDVTARELLDAGVRRLETQITNERSDVRAALYEAAGNAYRGLGAFDEAERVLDAAVKLRADAREREPAAYAQALLSTALLLRERGDFSGAEEHARSATGILENAAGESMHTLQHARFELAEILRRRAKLEEAAQLAEASMTAYEQAGDVLAQEYANAMFLLGRIRVAQSRLPEAERLLRRALDLQRRLGGELAEATIEARNGLADALVVMGESPRAEPLLREIVNNVRAIYGDHHPQVGIAYMNLGNALSDIPASMGEAESAYLKALEILRATNGPEHPEVATAHNNLGAFYLAVKDWKKADEAYQRAIAIRLKALGPAHPNTASAKVGRGMALSRLGEHREAETLLREGREILARNLGADHWRTAIAQQYLGVVLAKAGRVAEGEREVREAHAVLAKTLGAGHPRSAAALKSLQEVERE